MACVLVLNAVRFGAKCNAFWCKTQGKMVLNAVLFDAKRETRSINFHSNCIIKPLRTMKNMPKKGKIVVKKCGFRV